MSVLERKNWDPNVESNRNYIDFPDRLCLNLISLRSIIITPDLSLLYDKAKNSPRCKSMRRIDRSYLAIFFVLNIVEIRASHRTDLITVRANIILTFYKIRNIFMLNLLYKKPLHVEKYTPREHYAV